MPDVLVAREYDGKVEKGAQSESVCVCVLARVCVRVCIADALTCTLLPE